MAPTVKNLRSHLGRMIGQIGRGRGPAALVLVAACAYWIVYRIHTGICLEDALITYRYAENLVEGSGFVFNRGEHVLGTTTPLQAVVLAGPAVVVGSDHIPVISNVFMMLCALGTGILVYATLLRVGYSRPLALTCLAVFVFHPDIVWSTVGGMETPLVLFLMSLGLYAASVRSWGLIGLACGLLMMARIDGLIWWACLTLVVVVADKKAAAVALAVALAVLVPWIAFSTFYFGSPIPHSLLAKMHALGGSGLSDRLSAIELSRYYRWFADGSGVPPGGGMLPFEHMIWLGLVGLGGIGVIREHWRDTPMVLILFPLLYCAAFFLGGAPTTFEWYLIPFTWCCLILGVIGVRELWLMLVAYAREYAVPGWTPKVILAICLVMIGAGFLVSSRDSMRQNSLNQANENATRRRIGYWLRDHTSDDATVAMEALGYQGALSKRKVYDLAGLISPEVLRIRRESENNGQVYRRVIEELDPDYLVFRSFEVDEGIARGGGAMFATDEERADFFSRYEVIHRYVAPYAELWGNNARLTLYGRRKEG